jgi:hypothetical protein
MKKIIISILMLFIVCASVIALQPIGSILKTNNIVSPQEAIKYIGADAKRIYQEILSNLNENDRKSLLLGRNTQIGGATCSLEPDETYEHYTTTGTQLCAQNNDYTGMAFQAFKEVGWISLGELQLLKGERKCFTVTSNTNYTYTIYYCIQIGTTTCTETDSGEDYLNYGSLVFTPTSGSASTYYDNCLSGSTTSLQERWCDSAHTVQSSTKNCVDYGSNYVCESGACKSTQCGADRRECVTGTTYRVCAGGEWGSTLTCPSDAPSCNSATGTCIVTNSCDSTHLSLCTGQSSCNNAGGYWYGSPSTCHVNDETHSCDSAHVTLCTEQSTCEAATGHWYSNTCNVNEQTQTCSSTTKSYCSDQSTCEESSVGGHWYNNQCNDNEQTQDYVIYPTGLVIDMSKNYTFNETINFEVKLRTDSPNDIIGYVEIGVYCGDLKDYLNLGRSVNIFGRAYNVGPVISPCVSAESNYVKRRQVTIKQSDGEKLIGQFTLTVPPKGTKGGVNMATNNYASLTDEICYIRADTFDYCSASTPSTSAKYDQSNTEVKTPFNVYTGTIVNKNDIVCCDTKKTETEVVNLFKNTYNDYKSTVTIKHIADNVLNALPWIYKMLNPVNIFTSLFQSTYGRDVNTAILTTQWDGNTVLFRTTADRCTGSGYRIVNVSIENCKSEESKIEEKITEVAKTSLEGSGGSCNTDTDCTNKYTPHCDTNKTCTSGLDCPVGSIGGCTGDIYCPTEPTKIYQKCVTNCYVSQNTCVGEQYGGDIISAVSLTTDGKKFCFETLSKGTQCYNRKSVIDISEVSKLDRMSVFTFEGKTWLSDFSNPICLANLQNKDYQCEENGECLQALDSDFNDDKDNKIVYDGLKNIVVTNFQRMTSFYTSIYTLGIKDLTLWALGVNPTKEQVQQFGVCVYKDRDFISKIKKFIADTFKWDIDDPKVTYVMYGGAAAIVLFLFMLLKPQQPRYYGGGG